jgi:hypothetical protein
MTKRWEDLTTPQYLWLRKYDALNQELDHFGRLNDTAMMLIVVGLIIDHMKTPPKGGHPNG